MNTTEAVAIFGQHLASDLQEVTRDPEDLTQGWWVVVQTFEGEFFGFRFGNVSKNSEAFLNDLESDFIIPRESWASSLNRDQYECGVDSIREYIAAGWVYQTNYCRVLTADKPDDFNPCVLLNRINSFNPAPYASAIAIPKNESGLEFDVSIASASPELFLRREGNLIQSSPIKGTAQHAQMMLDKDSAENVMIVDLIRNDISHVCKPGTVTVPDLLRIEEHPGLAHLVSDVVGTLREDVTWAEILRAVMPPGSVSGAPKSSALDVISNLEQVKREVYCGTIGWIDVDNNRAELSVAIRTFWQSFANSSQVCFGTGAGITYESDPEGEWLETELKAEHLLRVAENTAG